MFIAVATLRPVSVPYPPTPWSCIVCGSLGGVDVTLNVLLFVPLGAALALAGAGRARAVIMGLLVTLTVETLQVTVIPGRDPALGDVVMNTLGTLLGFELARTRTRWLFPDGTVAVRLALVAGSAWLAVQVVTLQLLRPAVATHTLVVGPRPASAYIQPFDGQVLALALNGAMLRTALPSEIGSDKWNGPHVAMTLRTDSDASSGNGAIVRIAETVTDREFTMISRHLYNLTFRPRTRAMDFRLRGPLLELPEVFGANATGTFRDRKIVVGRSDWLLFAEVRGGRSVRAELRQGRGWSLVAPSAIPLNRYAPWLDIAWMASLVLPAGYWTARALRTGNGGRGGTLPGVTACVLVLLGAGLVGVPWLVGAPPPGWSELSGTVLGLALGGMVATALARS